MVVAPGVLQEEDLEASMHSRMWDTLYWEHRDSDGEMSPESLQECEAAWCSLMGLNYVQRDSMMTSKQTG